MTYVTRTMAEAAPLVRRPVHLMPSRSYQEIGIRSFGKGVFHKAPITGLDLGEKRVFAIEPGDLLFNIVFAWEGAVAVASNSEQGTIGSHRFLTCVVNSEIADARYLYWWFVGDRGREQLLRASPGGAGRNRTLGVQKLGAIAVPLPSLSEQREVVERLGKVARQVVSALKLRGEACEEREALVQAFERMVWPDRAKWPVKELSAVTTYLARGRQSEQGDSQHVLIKTQHVQQDRFVRSLLKLSHTAASKVKTDAHVRCGDILIACSAAGCLGRVARFEDAAPMTASTDTHIALARADTSLVTSDYLYAYLRGARGQYELRRRERGDWQREKVGFRLTELNMSELRSVPVPVPSLQEQDQIVSIVNAFRGRVGKLASVQSEMKNELEALLPAALNSSFDPAHQGLV